MKQKIKWFSVLVFASVMFVHLPNQVMAAQDVNGVESTGVNAGTMIVIVLLIGISIILIYSFLFKRKK